jgi:nitrate/nitrite transport system substrate-binding protein
LRFGIIALDRTNSPIVIAHEKGFFKKYGINSTVSKGANWAAIRDSLSNGDNQATHMLHRHAHRLDHGPARLAQEADDHPLAAQPERPVHHPQGELKGKVAPTPRRSSRWRGRKAKGDAHDLRHDLPPGHARHVDALLAGAGGINPDKDVSLITIPAAADGGQHEGGQDGRLLRGRALERARDRRRHRLHGA